MQKFKLKTVKYFGQMMADFIIKRIEDSSTQEELDFWFNLGAKLNAYCVVYYDLYLD